jgi:hypothetical protein
MDRDYSGKDCSDIKVDAEIEETISTLFIIKPVVEETWSLGRTRLIQMGQLTGFGEQTVSGILLPWPAPTEGCWFMKGCGFKTNVLSLLISYRYRGVLQQRRHSQRWSN